jgi:hypothetical protein
MKKFILILSIITIVSLLWACQDVIDIVDLTKVPINVTPTNPTDTNKIHSTIIVPDSTFWYVDEGYKYYGNPSYLNSHFWGSFMKVNKNIIKIDTANPEITFSLDIEIECTAPDKITPERKDRITMFRIKLDSLKINDNSMVHSEKNINWFEAYLKQVKDQKVLYFNQKDFNIDFNFYSVTQGIILGDFNVIFKNVQSQETVILMTKTNIYYKYKKNTN